MRVKCLRFCGKIAIVFTLLFNLLIPVLGQHSGLEEISSLTWSQDGNNLAVLVSGGVEGICPYYPNSSFVAIMDIVDNSFMPRSEIGAEFGCFHNSVDFNTAGTQLALGSSQGVTLIWSLETNERVLGYQGGQSLHKVIWNSRADNVFAINESTVDVYSSTQSQRLYGWTLPVQTETIVDASLSPDGDKLAIAISDGSIYIWNINTNFNDIVFVEHQNQVTAVAWNPYSSLVASGDITGRLILWDAVTGQVSATFNEHTASIFDLDWNRDGVTLASTAADGRLILWNISQTSIEYTITSSMPISTLEFSPYGGRLAFGGVFTNDSASMFLQDSTIVSIGNGAVYVAVPDPSLERLQSIAALCNAPLTVAEAIPDAAQGEQLTDFITQVESLPTDSIPPACAADLIAVAEAIQAGQ